MQVLILWVIIRFITIAVAGVVSEIRPMTLIEGIIPLLPPKLPLGQWLERSLLSPWMRWDALWYQRIVTQGYSASDGTAQFHPLYPWLASILFRMGISSSLSLLIISSIAGLTLFTFFYKLARLDLSSNDAFFALLLFVFSPPAFILLAPYSEALFLLTSVLCLLMLRKKNWWLAGLMGGLATLTRQQGLLLVIPMTVELIENSRQEFKGFITEWRAWFSLCFIPVGMLVWLCYRAFFINDFQVKISNFQAFIYSTLISPSAEMVVPSQKFIWPWQAIYYSLVKLVSKPDVDIWIDVIIGFLFVIILVISWKHIRLSYRLFALTITIISFSYYTGTIHPYMGLPRHLLLGFTIFIGLATVIKKPWMRLLTVGFSSAGMCFLLGLYVLNAWVP